MDTDTPTVSHVVERAAALADPDDHDEVATALVARFEDDPAGQMTVAAALWLATNPGQDHRREHVLREGARLAWHGDPPPAVSDWLDEQGIDA